MRQVVGYDRLEGERAYRQLGEVYQALRLYVNGFQPSMKLQAIQYGGRKVRRVYDTAKTPLQWLLLSHVLSPSKEQELQRMAHILDPLRLFHHLQGLQQVLFKWSAITSRNTVGTAPGGVFPFCVERCLTSSTPSLAESLGEAWQEKILLADVPDLVSPVMSEQETDLLVPATAAGASITPIVLIRHPEEESPFTTQPRGEETIARCAARTHSGVPGGEQSRAQRATASSNWSRHTPSPPAIGQAIQAYLDDQKSSHRRPKTLEWHEHALGLFQHYLQSQHQCLLLGQITQAQVSGWLEFLALVPTSSGSLRLPSTVESYARSARAFCHWSERHGYLQTTPFAYLALPRLETYELHPLAPQEWERLLLACRPTRKSDVLAEQAKVRNRVILWLLFETGIRVSELCRLRLSDVDREQGMLLIRGKDTQARRLTLGQEGLYSLRMYLDNHRFGGRACRVERGAGEDHLFLSERGDPLTKNGMALLFARLRKRAGIARKGINPALLRKSFALRFLQTGGDPLILQELLGYSDQSTSAHFRHLIAQVLARH